MNISLPGLRSGILVNPDRPYKLGPSVGGGPVDMVWCGVVWCGVVWCGVVWLQFLSARRKRCY